MKQSRYRPKRRILWDGRYKPYYELTDLDDFREEESEEDMFSDWLCFLDDIESVIREGV